MGWLFTHRQTRKELIKRLTQPYESKESGTKRVCLAHAARGNVLWTVWEIHYPDSHTERFIGCDLMRSERNYGWGYKDMEESMGLYYYTCPLSFLDMAPVACEEWREQVREYHARLKKKISVGDTIELEGCSIPKVKITRIRPLLGTYNGQTYRIPRKYLSLKATDKMLEGKNQANQPLTSSL